ncbi:PP2C family protein-serine/threonine phosphatase [Microscilla marina]|uniref:Serine/threonine kinase with GAF domain n=1 Tax=Microscilla marina ATCC 23134 TaxID=313606 RepID=A1ZWD6_MICM2|nr:SpoIIE family protein phosphatase [Microscilla marina]EAY25276.1 serine/threonine kinase with GAF domain [Microscilla marina ATCC 23134]
MKPITEDHLHEEWLHEKQRLRQRLSLWTIALTIMLYPGTLADYSMVASAEKSFFVWVRLIPSMVGALGLITFYTLRVPVQWVMYVTLVTVLTSSAYRPIPGDMANFVFTNGACLILMSAIPLIAFWQSVLFWLYLVGLNATVYMVVYADKVPLPQSGLVFTAALGVMFVVVSRFRHEIIHRNFLQSFQLKSQNDQINDQKNQLEALNEDLQEKNSMLTESIGYAKNIQTLLLPRPQDILRVFPQSFVFFKPRNQVSGDFYWLTEIHPHQPEKHGAIVVAMDCTGHGVPGALISMIGESLLKQVVNKEKIHAPHEILNSLHREIRHTLRQKESLNRDGMDMGVVHINFAQKTLQYAGACNTMIYFQDKQLHQLKGDSYSVGGEQREFNRCFTNHVVPLDKPTTFYLFSDGYQDQFGGNEGKKFMRKRFRETLQQIHTLPMPTQIQHLEQTLTQWQGHHEQVDDILVMGFRL